MPQTDAARDDRQLLAYLLRLLPEEETTRVEELTLAEDEVAERLRAVEHELVDGYIRGALDPGTRDRFESYYLSSPIRRERVRLAAEFLRAIDRVSASPAPAEAQPAPVRVRHWRGWGLGAVAAVLVLASATLLLQLEGGRPIGGRSAGPALPGEPTAPGAAAPSSAAAPLPQSEANPATPALVLFPQTRALASIPALRVPPGSGGVRFTLQLESNDYPRYQAGLRDPRTNGTIWRSAWLAPAAAGGRSAVEVVVPADVLKAQHYSLDLRGRTAGGAAHVVGSYAFNVTPP
jgi:hypothetical protein